MCAYGIAGITAQREFGDEAWRRRQIISISLAGRSRVLSTSMKEERVFMGASDDGDLEGGGGGGGGETVCVPLFGVGVLVSIVVAFFGLSERRLFDLVLEASILAL